MCVWCELTQCHGNVLSSRRVVCWLQWTVVVSMFFGAPFHCTSTHLDSGSFLHFQRWSWELTVHQDHISLESIRSPFLPCQRKWKKYYFLTIRRIAQRGKCKSKAWSQQAKWKNWTPHSDSLKWNVTSDLSRTKDLGMRGARYLCTEGLKPLGLRGN